MQGRGESEDRMTSGHDVVEQPEWGQLTMHSANSASSLEAACATPLSSSSPYGASAIPKILLRQGDDSDDSYDSDDDNDDETFPIFPVCKNVTLPSSAPELLVVFDMDHTLVGDLVSLSDRDNVETNMPWSWWPEGKERGLSPAAIVPYLQRGMMRPGLPELLSHLRLVGATIIVYTHSEDKWAVKVCQALERLAGWPFIHRVYSRMGKSSKLSPVSLGVFFILVLVFTLPSPCAHVNSISFDQVYMVCAHMTYIIHTDCRDGHPEFDARKSLEFICGDLKAQDGLDWVRVDKTIMFDDDRAAVSEVEADRLVTVASYDHWAPCPWDEHVNEEMLSRNNARLAQIVRARCSACVCRVGVASLVNI